MGVLKEGWGCWKRHEVLEEGWGCWKRHEVLEEGWGVRRGMGCWKRGGVLEEGWGCWKRMGQRSSHAHHMHRAVASTFLVVGPGSGVSKRGWCNWCSEVGRKMKQNQRC